jgi:hypothetical protein
MVRRIRQIRDKHTMNSYAMFLVAIQRAESIVAARGHVLRHFERNAPEYNFASTE